MTRLKILSTWLFFIIPFFCKSQNNQITVDSLNKYFKRVNSIEKIDKQHIEFLTRNNYSSQSDVFKFFLRNENSIDSIMEQPGYIAGHINYIISKEEIDPVLSTLLIKNTTGNPDWRKISNKVSKKYEAKYVNKVILDAKLRWYGHVGDTVSLIKYNIEKNEKYGLDTAGFGKATLNNIAYYMIFKHSDDPLDLNAAIKWMEAILRVEPNNGAFIDTYANLLYKIGRKKEALECEQKAILLDPKNTELLEAWEKMKQDLPTWPSHN